MNKTETITVIRSLLSSINSSCSLYSLNEDFKHETGIYIPLFGYGSLSEFLESIPDTVKLTGVYPIQKVSLVENDVSGHIVSLVKRQRRQKKSKKGVTCPRYYPNLNRPVSYKQNKGNWKQFDQRQRKAPQAREKEFQPKQQINQKRPNEKWKKIIVTDDHKAPKEEQNEIPCVQTVTEYPSISAHSSHSTVSIFSQHTVSNLPAGVVCSFLQAHEKLEATDLSLHCSVGDYIEVYPCEISHPGLFYLQLRKFKKKLSMFMDLLQQHYKQEISSLEDTPEVEQICTVRYTRYGNVPLWYRAQVEEILTDSLVVVRLVDYGTSVKVLTKNLKPLHRDFGSFPTQAVLGSLANITPSGTGSEWSKVATRRFHELAFCRDLVGGVVSMDCEKCGLGLALTSTVGKDVHINDTLVEEGLAEFDVKVVEGPKSFPFGTKLNLTPAFYSVENCSINSKLQKLFDFNN